jgi:hypothetical protein
MRWLPAAAAVLVLAAGCGSLGAHASPSPPVSGTPASGASAAGLELTEADTGKAFQLHPGQSVSVALHQRAGYAAWAQPRSTDGAVLGPRVDTRGAAPVGVTVGGFRAGGPGTAQLRSSTHPVCPPGQACPAVALAWAVTVTVS